MSSSFPLRLLLVSALLAAAGSAAAAPAIDATEYSSACAAEWKLEQEKLAKGEDKNAVARMVEAACIAKTGGTVRRDGQVLTIVKDAVTVRFTNVDACGGFEDCNFYELRDYYSDLGLYVVENRRWEGYGFIVVDGRTGRQSSMAERPHVSPDKRSIVSIEGSEAAGWSGIEAWSITPTGLQRTLRFGPKGYALYDFKRWRGSDRVEMSLDVNVGRETGEGLIKTVDAELVRIGAGWRVTQKEYPREACRPQPRKAVKTMSLAEEKSNLYSAGNTVFRVGNTLRIRTAAAESLTFADGDCGAFCSYRYAQRLDMNGLDVLARFREGSGVDYVLVDRRTGSRAEVAEIPDFALDFSTFSVIDGSAVEVWSFGRTGFARQARYADAGRYCFAGWNGLDQLMIGARVPGDPAIVDGTITRKGDGGWVKAVGSFADGTVPALDAKLDRTAKSVCRRQPKPDAYAAADYEAACLERLPGLAARVGGQLVLTLADGRTLTSDRAGKDCSNRTPLPCGAVLVDFDAAADTFLIGQGGADDRPMKVDRRSGTVATAPINPEATAREAAAAPPAK